MHSLTWERVSVIDNFITGRRENLQGVVTRLTWLKEASMIATPFELLADVDVVLRKPALPSVRNL